MHPLAQVSPYSRLRESLLYFSKLLKNFLKHLLAKANIEASWLKYGFLLLLPPTTHF